jgi:uncharacterized membrane protein AbrB (regulator of aidB expression)
MSKAGARFERRVLRLQLPVWLIAFVALVIGITIGLVPWIISERVKVP